MAKVKTFIVKPDYGLPDKSIAAFIDDAEKEYGFIVVHTTIIPTKTNTLFNVIVMKDEDHRI